jgi:HEAT repeat protein
MRRTSLVIAAVLLSNACVKSQNPARLVADLNHENRNTSVAAYRKLYSELLPKAIPVLVERLPGFGFGGQNYGMLVLGRYPDKQRRTPLRKLMNTGAPFLEGCSAAILYRAGDKKALPHLLAALRKDRVSVTARATMVRRLTGIDHPEVLAAVREMLVPGMHFSILAAVIDFAWANKDPLAVPAIEKLLRLKTTAGTARGLCAAFLVARGRLAHAAMLGQTLSRLSAVSTLIWNYLDRARRLQHTVLHGVAGHAAKTKNITSLRRALKVLRTREYRGLMPTLREVANRQNEKLAKVAFKILAEMPDQLKPKELREMLQSEKPWLALFAAETLRRRDDPVGLPRTLQLVARKDRMMNKYRVEAIRVLGGFRTNKVVQPLIDLLRHRVPGVRSRAYSSLQYVLRDLFPYSRFDFKTTGYKPWGKSAQREAAVRTIQAWWDENKS